MDDLQKFNIGFRSESVLKEMINYRKEDLLNVNLLHDACNILYDCISVLEATRLSEVHSKLYLLDFLLSYYDPFFNSQISAVELKKISNTQEKIIEGKRVSIGKLVDLENFWASLSTWCLTHKDDDNGVWYHDRLMRKFNLFGD